MEGRRVGGVGRWGDKSHENRALCPEKIRPLMDPMWKAHRQHVADLTAWHVGKSVGCEVATPTEIREQNCRSIPRIVKDEHPLTAEDNWRYSCQALIMCWRKTLAGWQFPSYTMHPSSELSEKEKQQQQRFPFWAQSAARHWCRLSHLVATIL